MPDETRNEAEANEAKPTITIAERPSDGREKETITIAEKPEESKKPQDDTI